MSKFSQFLIRSYSRVTLLNDISKNYHVIEYNLFFLRYQPCKRLFHLQQTQHTAFDLKLITLFKSWYIFQVDHQIKNLPVSLNLGVISTHFSKSRIGIPSSFWSFLVDAPAFSWAFPHPMHLHIYWLNYPLWTYLKNIYLPATVTLSPVKIFL